MTHIAFPSLEQFNSIYHRATYGDKRPTLTWRAKIKLHGANLALAVWPDKRVIPQARRSMITREKDLSNFCDFFEPQQAIWAEASGDELVTFWGEWAGPGVAKGDAVQLTDRKRLYIFAVGIGIAPHYLDDTQQMPKWMITDPEVIETYIPKGISRDLVRVLPYELDPCVIDFSDEENVAAVLSQLNEKVEAVEQVDPYIAREFGIEKAGEGYVMVPHASAPGELSGEQYARLSFKAKTENHRVRKQGKPAVAKAPLPQTAIDFVETFCTEARMRQAMEEVCDGRPDMKQMGPMVFWMHADIEKEAASEIEALGIPFDKLKRPISDATRTWFMSLAKTISPNP